MLGIVCSMDSLQGKSDSTTKSKVTVLVNLLNAFFSTPPTSILPPWCVVEAFQAEPKLICRLSRHKCGDPLSRRGCVDQLDNSLATVYPDMLNESW